MWIATITRPCVDKNGNPATERVSVKMGGPYASVSEAFAAAQRRFNWQGCKVHLVVKATEPKDPTSSEEVVALITALENANA